MHIQRNTLACLSILCTAYRAVFARSVIDGVPAGLALKLHHKLQIAGIIDIVIGICPNISIVFILFRTTGVVEIRPSLENLHRIPARVGMHGICDKLTCTRLFSIGSDIAVLEGTHRYLVPHMVYHIYGDILIGHDKFTALGFVVPMHFNVYGFALCVFIKEIGYL